MPELFNLINMLFSKKVFKYLTDEKAQRYVDRGIKSLEKIQKTRVKLNKIIQLGGGQRKKRRYVSQIKRYKKIGVQHGGFILPLYFKLFQKGLQKYVTEMPKIVKKGREYVAKI